MMPPTDPGLPLVYISHVDQERDWYYLLSDHLQSALRKKVNIWYEIVMSSEILSDAARVAIGSAKVAIILTSVDYLASDFHDTQELPLLLERASRGNLPIIVVPIRAAYLEASKLHQFPFALPPNRPLASLADHERDLALVEVVKMVDGLLATSTEQLKAMPVSIYITQLELRNFKNFRHETIHFIDPSVDSAPYHNVTLIVGQNSSGKTSILRAVCLSILAEILPGSGYVPRFLVREEKDIDDAQLIANLRVNDKSLIAQARIHRNKGLNRQEADPGLDVLFGEGSSEFLVLGYGSSRWVPLPGPYDAPGQRDKARLLPYQRVASLFEDNFGLMPLEAWLNSGVYGKNRNSGSVLADVLNDLLKPTGLHFDLENMCFHKDGIALPLDALADGYRYYISWLSDLLYHMTRVLPQPLDLSMIKALKGIVLVDEIDLHLHASWQRVVIETISSTFPNLQFIFTTHSPLVAGSLPSKRILVMQQHADGTAKVVQLDQNIEGLDADQILLTPYFGLETTRSGSFSREVKALYELAAAGDRDARLKILQLHAAGVEHPS